jgi:dephospho-CoA kinase
MMVIGLTGSLATGKSTVAEKFRRKGAAVINADQTAHELLAQNGACKKAVVKTFGLGILTLGRIDRKKLGRIVFNDAVALKKLTRVIHPAVIKEFRRKISDYRKGGKVRVVVMDVPLLFESGMDRLADVTITVKAARQEQIARAVRRFNITKSEALKRIKNQMPLSKKILLSDIIIDNRGSLKNLNAQADAVWNKLQKRYSI